jgi:NTP pyrophosphatase (non-canonical NTP hydrolase)
MDFKKVVERAREIRKLYAESDKKRLGKEWSRGEYVKAFVGDVGALVKLTMGKDGLRDIEDVEKKLAHEFADILWSVIMLAEMYEINLEKSFFETMDELEERASKGVLAKTQARYGRFDR